MATYKVIQDIEAEDKFLGPLTLKQFIFAMSGALFSYLSFFMAAKHLYLGLVVTLPLAFFGFFMAVPWSSEQPTDIWVLAKIRFRIKPKKRIWDQSGLQELVTITAPKKEEKPKFRDISQTEVKGKLKALADTIDSRGWIIKNTPVGPEPERGSDRLVNTDSFSLPVPAVDTDAIPDMLEEDKGLKNMLEQSGKNQKDHLYEKMDRIRRGEPEIPHEQPLVAPSGGDISGEQEISAQLKEKRRAGDLARNNMHSISSSLKPALTAKPKATQIQTGDDGSPSQPTGAKKAQAPMTEPLSPDILNLARNNDLNVSTIARQANRGGNATGEIVISLH